MQHLTTTAPVCNIPDTIETVVENEDGILLWVEDNRPSPCQWDSHAAAPSGEMATAQREKEAAVYRKLHEDADRMAAEVAEIDFMDAALERIRANGQGSEDSLPVLNGAHLHEDPNDGRDWRDEVPGYRSPYRL